MARSTEVVHPKAYTTRPVNPYSELAGLLRWLPFYLKPKKNEPDKFDKIPTLTATYGVSTKDHSRWLTLDEALELRKQLNCPGVTFNITGGVVDLTGAWQLLVLDFDGVTGAVPLLVELRTFMGVSVSGKGIRAFAWVPAAWAERFDDTPRFYPGDCDHAEAYLGRAARHLTATSQPLNDCPINRLDEAALAALEPFMKVRKASAPDVAPPDVIGSPVELMRYSLSPDQTHLINGTGNIDRSAILHGFLIKLIDEGKTKEDLLATMVQTPALWRYCLSHRNEDETKALRFAGEEISRAWAKSQTGMRQALIGFGKRPSDAPTVVEEPPQAEPVQPAYPPPYPGPMADAVAACLEVSNKPQPELATLAVLVAMAASCGSIYARADGSTVNLYGIGVLPTAGGKNKPQQKAKEFAKLGGAKVINAPASGEGIEDELVSNKGTLCVIDEIGHLIALTNSVKAMPHHITMMKKILELFSAGSDPNYTTRARAGKEAIKIPNPAFNLLGFTTPGVLGNALTLADIDNGLAGRMLFVYTENNPKNRLIDVDMTMPKSFCRAAMHIDHQLLTRLGTGKPIKIGLANGAQALREALNDEFDQRGRDKGTPYEQALCARSMENTEHIAGTLAVFDNPARPMITVDHLEWAARFVRASNAAALGFVETEMNNGEQQKNAAKVLKLLSKGVFSPQKGRDGKPKPSQVAALAEGFVPRSLLLRDTRLDTKELQLALEYLGQSDKVVVGKHDGIDVVQLVNNG